MTATWSANSLEVAMSCVINIKLVLVSRLMRLSTFMMLACVRTSSADVGSSSSTSGGCKTSAMAKITRCRMPPLSSKAYRAMKSSGTPTI